MTEKKNFIREFSRYLHKTQRQDNFYSILVGHWTVLYPALSTQLILLTSKVGRVFVLISFHHKRARNFLIHLEYVGEYGPDNVRYKYPEIGRKYYEYRSNDTAAKTIQVTDSDWINAESGTEETSTVPTQYSLYPGQQQIEEIIKNYNNVPQKYFINEGYFLFDKSDLIKETYYWIK